MPSDEELKLRLEKAEQQAAAAQQKAARIRAQVKEAERKAEAHRKIIIGGSVESLLGEKLELTADKKALTEESFKKIESISIGKKVIETLGSPEEFDYEKWFSFLHNTNLENTKQKYAKGKKITSDASEEGIDFRQDLYEN